MRLLSSNANAAGPVLVTAILASTAPAPASGAYFNDLDSLSSGAQQMFTESMGWMDTFYDPKAGYLYDFSAATALRHETRSSVWYAFGLLARDQGDDAAEAEKIITNVISGQFKVESEEWYGDYQKYPEEPYVGSAAYAPSIYNSWDPNWRGFIGTTLVLVMEEFSDRISENTQELILKSLYNATVGDSYRVGSLDPEKDNLFPAYSNPSIMRAFVTGWTGRRLSEPNMTRAGEQYAQEVVDLFDEFETLSEFNSGTYTGVSLFGLVLWSHYLPAGSAMAQDGPRMINATWEAVSALWHPGLKNMAGPWDRSYGYDMNRYLSLMALWLWPLIGKEEAGLFPNPQVMSHSADYAWAPVLAVLSDVHQSLIPTEILDNLLLSSGPGGFTGEHTFETSTRYPPFDNAPRNFTTWLSERITIGAESYDEIGVGGPSRSQTSFNPAVVQWDTGDEVSFISLYPTERALTVKVEPWKLSLSYPYGTPDSVFTFVVGTFAKKPTLSGWGDLQGLNVTISGNNVEVAAYEVSFGGAGGGDDAPIQDFEYWNLTHKMVPGSLTGVPEIVLEFGRVVLAVH